jgi:hypothetical protein
LRRVAVVISSNFLSASRVLWKVPYNSLSEKTLTSNSGKNGEN